VVARITEDGLALVDSLVAPMSETHARQLRHVSQTRLRALLSLLTDARTPPATEP